MTVVAGVTLKPEGRALAEVAARFAKGLGVRLRLVHISEDPRAPLILGTDQEPLLGPIRASLNELAEELVATTGAAVHPHLAAGPPSRHARIDRGVRAGNGAPRRSRPRIEAAHRGARRPAEPGPSHRGPRRAAIGRLAPR